MFEIMDKSTVEVLDNGMNCLLNQLGVIETERFLTIVLREKFDYTKWRRKVFDDMSVAEFSQGAVDYAKEHPFLPNKKQIPI